MIEMNSFGSLDVTAKEAHSYSRYVPNVFNFCSKNRELRDFIARVLSEREVNCPAEGAWLVKDCFLVNGKHVVLRSGQVVEQTIVDQPDQGYARQLSALERGKPRELRELAGNDDPLVSIMKAGAANYGHMLIEMLPRLLNAKKIGLVRFNLALPPESLWAKPVLDLVGEALGLTLKYLHCDEVMHVDELVVMSPTSKHNIRKSHTAIELGDRLLAHVCEGDGRQRERIAVWRRPDEKRAIAEDEVLLQSLQSDGYEVVYPATMPFAEQIRIFSSAKHIVAPLGAGLTNMLFAPPSASIFMLDPGLYDFFYWDLACLKGQEFTWYFSTMIEQFRVEMLERGTAVDSADILAALRRSGFM